MPEKQKQSGQLAEKAIIQAKLEIEKSQQSQVIKESETDRKNFH
jgi:hypothetical protein